MDLTEVKQRLSATEKELKNQDVVKFAMFETPYGELIVNITGRLRHQCRKGKVWKSNAMLTALKNAAYGFNKNSSKSRGGADGIFLLDRGHRPRNMMMKKMFDRFLDKPDPFSHDTRSNDSA